MHLLRIFFFEAISEFHMQASHISRVHNRLADALTHDKLSCFYPKDYTILPSPILVKFPILVKDA